MNDLLLLSTLLGGPRHGYALKKLAGLLAGRAEMHNNLVYPLLRRFVENGWVSQQTTGGKRGQTRELYTLTEKGKRELLLRLSRFTKKEALSEGEFRLRVGLFSVLDKETRKAILEERRGWLVQYQERLGKLHTAMVAMNADAWGHAVLGYISAQIRTELRWIAGLQRQISEGKKTPKQVTKK
jgi:DNA-binding PadR family transcriptional regulator